MAPGLFDYLPEDRCPICRRHAPWSPLDPRDGMMRWAVACPQHRPVIHLPQQHPDRIESTILGDK